MVVNEGIALKHSHKKNRSLHSLIYLKYKLIEDLVHHILSGCDVYYGLRRNGEFCKQVLVLLRTVTHWETCFHGVKLVPHLDLRRG